MNNVKKISFLVGNGFDISILSALNKSTKTGYDDFYHFVKLNHPECNNMLLQEMEQLKSFSEKNKIEDEDTNWSNFESIIDEKLKQTDCNKEELWSSLHEFQEYFSEFLDSIITVDVIKELSRYAREKHFFTSSIQKFLGDIGAQIQHCKFAKEFDHHNVLDIKFFNFNYTSLLDNLIYQDHEEFHPKAFKGSDNNFILNVNPELHSEVHRNSTEKYCQLETEVIHPHGIQQIPRSILFGNGEQYLTKKMLFGNTEKSRQIVFSKPYWARYEERYAPKLKGTDLYVIYGMSMGKTDSWWWNKIYQDLYQNKSQLIIYNFLKNNKDPITTFLDSVTLSARNDDSVRKNIFVVNFTSKDIEFPSLFKMEQP